MGRSFVRIHFLLIAATLAASTAALSQQTPQTYTPQTYTPQTYSPPGYQHQQHSPPGYAPQLDTSANQTQQRPLRRRFWCVIDDDSGNYCTFYSGRDFRGGYPCTCNGLAGYIY